MKLLLKNLDNLLWLFVSIFLCLSFFWPFIVKNKIPLPADTIMGMYHPWRDVVWNDLTAGVPFKNPLITDPVRQQYIWKKLVIDQYKKWNWPLWNPYTHSGMPLLANFQSGSFYPLNILFFLMDFKIAWGFYILSQPLLAIFFMFYYLKELKLNSFSAAFGAFVFAFCGFSVAWLEWGNIFSTLLWLPLILLSIEKISKFKSPRWLVIFIFSLAVSFFAGHLQTAFYVILLTASYFFLKTKKLKGNYKKFFLQCALFSFLIFILLTSIQWLPTLELILNSARENDINYVLSRNDWFIPWQNLIQLLVPDFFGNPATGNYWGVWNYGEFVSFIGVVPLFFAFLGLFFYKKNRFVFFYGLLFFIFLSFALPTFWAKIPYLLKIPLFSSLQPSRLLSLIDFCLAVLAAFGMNYFINRSPNLNKKLTLILGIFILFFLCLWMFVILAGNFLNSIEWKNNLFVAKRNLIFPSASFLFLALMLIFRIKNENKNLLNKIIVIGLFILTIIELFRFAGKFTPFTSKEWIFPETQTIRYLLEDESLFRIMTTDRRIMPANFSAYYKIQSISGYDPLYLKDYGLLITELESGEKGKLASFNRIIEPSNYSSALIDKLNVKYVLSLSDISSSKLSKIYQEGETRIYFNEAFKQRVNLEKPEQGSVKIIEYQDNKIILIADTKKDNRLIISDMYLPGWRAEINGKKTPIKKNIENFRLIDLPKGQNLIILRYQPTSFFIGKILFFSGFLFVLVFFELSQKLHLHLNS